MLHSQSRQSSQSSCYGLTCRLNCFQRTQRYAQYQLGKCYEYGIGVLTDKREAMRWYRLAADQGQSDANNRLKSMFKSEYSYNEVMEKICSTP